MLFLQKTIESWYLTVGIFPGPVVAPVLLKDDFMVYKNLGAKQPDLRETVSLVDVDLLWLLLVADDFSQLCLLEKGLV